MKRNLKMVKLEDSDEFVMAEGAAPYQELYDIGKAKLIKYGRGQNCSNQRNLISILAKSILGDGYWNPSALPDGSSALVSLKHLKASGFTVLIKC